MSRSTSTASPSRRKVAHMTDKTGERPTSPKRNAFANHLRPEGELRLQRSIDALQTRLLKACKIRAGEAAHPRYFLFSPVGTGLLYFLKSANKKGVSDAFPMFPELRQTYSMLEHSFSKSFIVTLPLRERLGLQQRAVPPRYNTSQQDSRQSP